MELKTDDPLEALLVKALRDALLTTQAELTDAEICEMAMAGLAAAADLHVESLNRRTVALIRNTEKVTNGFEARNIRRWRPAFTAFEKLWTASSELTTALVNKARPQAVADDDYKFEALCQLNAKGLLIARECMALMRAGYAEGALARWRALHEVSAVAVFLSNSGREISIRYLLSFRFQAYRAAIQIDEHLGKGTNDSFEDHEIEAMRLECERIKAAHGFDLTPDYEWARPGFKRTVIPAKKAITFRDLETEVGLEGLRPYYRWASQHNHAAFQPAGKGLGLAESVETLFLIGPSNSGMVDPLQLAAMSLVKCVVVFLSLNTSVEVAVNLMVLKHLREAVGPVAAEAEASTKAAYDRRLAGWRSMLAVLKNNPWKNLLRR